MLNLVPLQLPCDRAHSHHNFPLLEQEPLVEEHDQSPQRDYCKSIQLFVRHGRLNFVYPKSSAVLAAARLHPIAYYITKQRQTVLKAIEGRPILDACREAERRRGSPSRQYWWEQNFSLAGYEPEWEKNSHLAEASGPE